MTIRKVKILFNKKLEFFFLAIYFLLYFLNTEVFPGITDKVASYGKDITTIINNSVSRDIIKLKKGSYAGGSIIRDNITIIGDSKEVFITSPININANDVVLDGLCWDTIEGNALVNIRGRNNTIKNCIFKKFGKMSSSKAIWIRGDGFYPNNIIENCKFDNWAADKIHASCIKVGQDKTNYIYRGTLIKSNIFINGAVGGNSPAIQLFCPSTVKNNRINNCEDGIEVKGSDMVVKNNIVSNCYGAEAMSNRNGSNNLYAKNVLFNIRKCAWQIWSGSHNVFQNNIIYNSERIAMIKGGYISGEQASDVILLNNTFVKNDRGISWDVKNFPPSNIQFINNIFVGDGSSSIEIYGKPSITVCRNNHFFNFIIPEYSKKHTQGKPAFIDEDLYDYHLKQSSPAIDTGYSLPNEYYHNYPIDCDALGMAKDGNNDGTATYDKGAYEY